MKRALRLALIITFQIYPLGLLVSVILSNLFGKSFSLLGLAVTTLVTPHSFLFQLSVDYWFFVSFAVLFGISFYLILKVFPDETKNESVKIDPDNQIPKDTP